MYKQAYADLWTSNQITLSISMYFVYDIIFIDIMYVHNGYKYIHDDIYVQNQKKLHIVVGHTFYTNQFL